MVKRHRVLRVPSGGISMLVFFLVAVQDSLSSPPFQEKYKVSLSLIPQNLRPPFFESRGSSQMEYKISLSVPLDGQANEGLPRRSSKKRGADNVRKKL